MDFNLTEDQQMIKEQAADFAERFLAPTIEERDKNHVWDRKIINEMIENGFQGICFPEEYGGAGMDVLSYILAVEEMSKVDDGTHNILQQGCYALAKRHKRQSCLALDITV